MYNWQLTRVFWRTVWTYVRGQHMEAVDGGHGEQYWSIYRHTDIGNTRWQVSNVTSLITPTHLHLRNLKFEVSRESLSKWSSFSSSWHHNNSSRVSVVPSHCFRFPWSRTLFCQFAIPNFSGSCWTPSSVGFLRRSLYCCFYIGRLLTVSSSRVQTNLLSVLLQNTLSLTSNSYRQR